MVVPLIVTPYLIRTIGFNGIGEIAFSLAICSYFGIIIRFGFNISNSRDLAKNSCHNENAVSIINSTFLIQILLSIISIVAVSLLNWLFIDISWSLIQCVIVLTVVQSLTPYWYFQALEEVKGIAIVTGFSKICYVILVLFFVTSYDDLIRVVFFNALTASIVLLYSISKITNRYNLFSNFFVSLKFKSQLRNSKNEFVTQLAPSLYNNSSVFFLGLFSSSSMVGVYFSIQSLLEIILTTIRVMLSAFIGSLAKDKQLHSLFSKITITMLLFIVFFLFSFQGYILDFYLSEVNDVSKLLFSLGLFGTLFGGLFIVYNSGYLMLYGKSKLARNITVVFSLLGVILNPLLISIFNVVGAMVAVVISRILLGLSSYYYSKKG